MCVYMLLASNHSGAVQQAAEAVGTAPLIQIPVLLKIALVLSCLLFFQTEGRRGKG